MKKYILSALMLLAGIGVSLAQQTVAGTTYFLPKTALRFAVKVEKTTYTPGQFAMYAFRYMKKKDVALHPAETYRVVDIRMNTIGVPDSTKQFTLNLDKKLSISEVDRDESGLLLAINAKGRQVALPERFVPAPKQPQPNPNDYMNEDILSAGSTAKMAELTAKDIYDIRESRNQLARGQADFMPKDGTQLRIMMENLDAQERALLQTFEGTMVRDTVETIITFVPQPDEERSVLFRFSQHLGITDADDLAGTPYYIMVAPEGNVPEGVPAEKESKDNFGLCVNIPDKIQVTLTHDSRIVKTYECYAGQFGRTEYLSAELFGKKNTSHILLNPISGSIEKIESETLK